MLYTPGIKDSDVEGYTGQDGTVTFENVTEGFYNIYTTAKDHTSSNEVVYVSPGILNEAELFIQKQVRKLIC